MYVLNLCHANLNENEENRPKEAEEIARINGSSSHSPRRCLISIRIADDRMKSEMRNGCEWRARRRLIQIKQEVNETDGKHKKGTNGGDYNGTQRKKLR